MNTFKQQTIKRGQEKCLIHIIYLDINGEHAIEKMLLWKNCGFLVF